MSTGIITDPLKLAKRFYLCDCQECVGCDFCCNVCPGGFSCSWLVTFNNLSGPCACLNGAWTLFRQGPFPGFCAAMKVIPGCGTLTWTFDLTDRWRLTINGVGFNQIYNHPHPETSTSLAYCCYPMTLDLVFGGFGCEGIFPQTLTIIPTSSCADCDADGMIANKCGNCGIDGEPMAKNWAFSVNGVVGGCAQCSQYNQGWVVRWTRADSSFAHTGTCMFMGPPAVGLPALCGGTRRNAWPILIYQAQFLRWALIFPDNATYVCPVLQFDCLMPNNFVLDNMGLACLGWPPSLLLTPSA